MANAEGVTGFLYLHLKNLGLLDLLPTKFSGSLENEYLQTRNHANAVLAEMKILSAGLEKVGIRAVALQGLSMASMYEDPGLRPLGDADVMVKPGHEQMLKGLLWKAGYRAPDIMYPHLLSKDDLWIDVHTHILNLDRIHSRRYIFPEDLTPMWERAFPFFGQTGGLLRLDPFDNFIGLAAHALKHSYSRLIWSVDLHICIRKWANSAQGWEALIERARVWKQERIVLYSLFLIGRIFGLKVPYWVLCELGIQRLNVIERHLLRLRLRGLSSRLMSNILWIMNISRMGMKLEFMKETLFPKGEIINQVFPNSSRATRRSLYGKRIARTAILMMKDLHQAIVFSLRTGINE